MYKYVSFLISLVFVLGLISTPLARAATRTWDHEGLDNRWETAANWSNDKIPGTGDIARIVMTGADECRINDLVIAEIKNLQVGRNVGGTALGGDFRILPGGSLSFTATSSVGNQAEGRFFMDGGTVTADGSLSVGQALDGLGYLYMSGGSITTSAVLEFGDSLGGVGHLIMTGGTIDVGSPEVNRATRVGNDGGTGFATISGGVLNAYGNLVVGRARDVTDEVETPSEGLLTVLGGTINVGSTTSPSDLSIGKQYGRGVLEMSDGVINVIGDVCVGENVDQIIEDPFEIIPRPGIGRLTMTGGLLSIADSNSLKIGLDGSTGVVELIDGAILAGDLLIGEPGSGGKMDIRQGTLILEGNQMTDILGLISAGLLTAYGTDGSGPVVQWQYDYNVRNPGKTTVSAIPEPATLILLGLGGLVLRRRKSRA
jgi:hypothetical protein